MSAEKQTPPDEPKEKTPKGYEVPTPKRSDFLRNLKKVAKVKR